MTTGSWSTGPYGRTTKFHAAKSWFGDDGKYVTDRISKTPKWNAYTMCHVWFHSGNPNELGFIDQFDHLYKVADNHSWDAGGGSDSIASGYGGFYGDGTINPTFPAAQFNEFWTAEDESKLLSKLLKRVKGHELHLGVALAEVDKLAGTVLGTIKSLVFGLNDLAHMRVGAFARRFGAGPPRKDRVERLKLLDISGRFLEMRYAWEPTLADVQEAAIAFEALSNGPRKYLNRARRRISRPSVYHTNYCRVNQTVTAQRSYLFEMYEEMDAFRQMGLTDLASVLWERVPLSFVFDWFIPIGTYLSLIGQIPFMKGRFMRTSSIAWQSSGTYAMDPIFGNVSAPPSVDCDWMRYNMQRVPLSSPPSVPMPQFKVAGAVQGKRIQNAIALAHQFLAGGGDRVFYHY
jgi:hypothetical protein